MAKEISSLQVLYHMLTMFLIWATSLDVCYQLMYSLGIADLWVITLFTFVELMSMAQLQRPKLKKKVKPLKRFVITITKSTSKFMSFLTVTLKSLAEPQLLNKPKLLKKSS